MNSISGRRALVLVIDACGVGALPDAADYGDEGTNTLAHVAAAVGGLALPALSALGLGHITPVAGVAACADPAIHGRLHPLGPGKDSVSGHWELMGVVVQRAPPTYPEGFPAAVTSQIVAATGHEVICNRPDNGLTAIEQFGAEHLRTGALILYTSQDSVLQLAAHVERVSTAELHRMCEAVRAVMVDEHAVGRVIARPFTGATGAFRRTDGRRDFTVRPPSGGYLAKLQEAQVEVHGVGKIGDLFAGVGLDACHPGASNAEALASAERVLGRLQHGLVLVNLIETDQVYGHRNDAHGFARALAEIDAHLTGLLTRLRDQDLLIVTADHGVDPSHPGTDHTREYAPLLAVTGAMLRGREGAGRTQCRRHDGPLADVGASVLRWLAPHARSSERLEALPGHAFIS